MFAFYISILQHVLHPIRPCLGGFEAQSVPKISNGPNHCLFHLVRQLEIEFVRLFPLCAPQYIAVYPPFDVQYVRHCVCHFEALSVVILMTQPLQRLSTHLSYLEIEFRRQVRFFASQ
mgnify:CR=1 FL=1